MIAIIERDKLLKEIISLRRLTNADTLRIEAREPSLFLTMDNRTVILKADVQENGRVKVKPDSFIGALRSLDSELVRLSAYAGVYLDIYAGKTCRTIEQLK